ncbi:hypothetical protein C9374_006513 [Naegleria lovaniensis]|uniref:Protein kinase domain-containing protein n=1 Tax=Naegleria lovaniensis TaxID=51637 RepID=A0AA88GID2_NAELO|nr:uncharacterized protein C9374_006513 [Naegleria lovaniensis]KAG2381524.1 hypothetical protein C9374_006513 [Naegleria lovaniensis]
MGATPRSEMKKVIQLSSTAKEQSSADSYCTDHTTSINWVYFVGTPQNPSLSNISCTLNRTEQNPCWSFNEIFTHLSIDILNRLPKSNSTDYVCLNYTVTINVVSDMVENRGRRTACYNNLPDVDLTVNRVHIALTITSTDALTPKVISCFKEERHILSHPPFLLEPQPMTSIIIDNVKVHNMFLRAHGIRRTILQDVIIQDNHVNTDFFKAEHSKLIDSSIILPETDEVFLENTTFSGYLLIDGCKTVYINNLWYHENNRSRLKFTNCNTVLMENSKFHIAQRTAIIFETTINVAISSSEFEYIHTEDGDEDEYTITVSLVFNMKILGSVFKNKKGGGWIKMVSVGKVFAALTASNNTCTKAETIFYFYLCKIVEISNSLLSNNSASHSGAMIVMKSDSVTIGNTILDGNTAIKNGAISLAEICDTISVYSSVFTNNHALKGSGGAMSVLGGRNKMYLMDNDFSSNGAKISGGALHAMHVHHLEISLTTFQRNTVEYIIRDDSSFYLSSGGAISLFNCQATTITDTKFINNQANRGGALYTGDATAISDSLFKNNFAFDTGGAIFYASSFGSEFDYVNQTLPVLLDNVLMEENRAAIYGSNISSPIVSFSASIVEKMTDGGIFKYYPGEKMVLQFNHMLDRQGNNIPVLYELPSIKISDNNFVLETNYSKHKENLIEIQIAIQQTSTVDLTNYHAPISISISFSETNFSIVIPFLIDECPQDFVVSYGKCVSGFPLSKVIPAIIATSIVLTFLAIVGGAFICVFCGLCSWKMIKVARGVYVRQRSEKEIEEKLLQQNIPIEEYGSVNSDEHNRSAATHNNDYYIISAHELKIKKKIGEGSSGSVYKAKYNMMDVAVKSIVRSDDTHENFEKEVMLLVQLRHPNIISFYGICISESQMCMVVELGQNGSLEEMIKEMKKGKMKMTFKEKLKILIGISNGMKYLHSIQPKCLIHRDLKPGNIILDHSNTPKVCDFGLSRAVSINTQTNSLTANIGTLIYMSPELILEDDSSEERIKMFNLLYHVANNEKRPLIPFSNVDEMCIWCEKFMTNDDATNEDFLIGFDMYIKLMKQCWSTNPRERPSFERILLKLTDIFNMDL